MSSKTGIQWTDATWNPVSGCTQVSPGCAHCYAKELHDKRHRAHLVGKAVAPQYAVPFETVQLKPERLDVPLRWRRPRRVFVNSVSDLFHDDVPDEFIEKVFAVMALAQRHTFQVLTKRPKRMLEWFTARAGLDMREEAVASWAQHMGKIVWDPRGSDHWRYARAAPADVANRRVWPGWPLPNVWIGVSVENQRFADERIPLLLRTPAAVRFLSCEPLLGRAMLTPYLWSGVHPGERWWRTTPSPIQWVIAGGESGALARPTDVQWLRDIKSQCERAGVPIFVKQLGAQPGFRLEDEEARGNMVPSFHHYDAPSGLFIKRLRDRHGADMSEWPSELCVREFPGLGNLTPTVTPEVAP